MPVAPGQKPQRQDFWGCESVDVGGFEGDSCAYIATLEAFHGMPLGVQPCFESLTSTGTTVAVYIKQSLGLERIAWKRYVLDVYGTPTQQSKQGNGEGIRLTGYYCLAAAKDIFRPWPFRCDRRF